MATGLLKKYYGSLLVLCCVLIPLQALVPHASRAADSDFPVPDNIRPAINFWIKVYTEADTQSGFLHDASNLSIIYAKLSRDRSTINEQRSRIEADLQVLASGKRDNLTASQQRILALWPSDVSNDRLLKAAGEVRWQLGQSDRFTEGLKRSGAYRDHIEAVIQEKGMPIELAILPHVESSFHPGAYSSAAATGMWQFIRSTAQRFMQVDYVVDERLDPYRATHGAMELLEFNYNVLGTWPLALTAYNHGANGIARAVRDVGSNDIGRVIAEYKGPRFGFASRNFYPQFLAALEVERRAMEFFGPVEMDTHPGFLEQELTAYVDARVLADTLGISIRDLQRDNPALQASVWSGSKRIPRGYPIKVRKDAFPTTDLLASLSSIPSGQLFNDQIPDLSYAVRRGDTLSMIAERYKTTISELVAINQLRDRHTIYVGQNLLLPQRDGSVPTLLVNNNGLGPREMPANGIYEVRRGDSLSVIAEHFRVPESQLLALNSLENGNLIFPGQSLRLRAEAEVQTAGLQLANVDVPAADEAVETAEQPVTAAREPARPVRETPRTVERISAQADLQAGLRNVALEDNAAARVRESREELLVDLQTDPADYSVAVNDTIEIQSIETLGHYAEWLGVRAWDLRRLNGMVYGEPVIIGERLKLDFSKVDKETFEQRRLAFHRDIQQQYFANWRIQETEEYSIKRRDYLDNLTRQRSVPLWLFRQYNPGVNFQNLQIGQVVVFPVVERVL